MQKASAQNSNLFAGFLNREVLVKAQDEFSVTGRLLRAYPSDHGDFGNLLIWAENRLFLIRGSQIISVIRQEI